MIQGDDSEVYDQDQPPTNSYFIDMKEAGMDLKLLLEQFRNLTKWAPPSQSNRQFFLDGKNVLQALGSMCIHLSLVTNIAVIFFWFMI